MSLSTQYPHLLIDAHGVARIGDTRFRVMHLAAEHYLHGWSAEEILRQHPELKPEEVYSALTYYYDHREELIAELNRSYVASNKARRRQSLSREALLSRKGSNVSNAADSSEQKAD